MENIPTPPNLDETICDIAYNIKKHTLSIKQFNDDDMLKIMLIHELRVMNFNLDDIRISLISIANDITMGK